MLFSIDPGKNEFAWALFDNKKLIKCGMCEVDNIRDLVYGVMIDEVVIEVPQIYMQRKWKGDPNDLIDVAVTAGRVAGQFSQVEFVRPRIWKGNRPKDIDNNYTLSQLISKELTILNICGVQKSKRHNVVDAIGIGLWKLGRR